MASKRKLNQDDLRKMMAKVKTGSNVSGPGSNVSKRYKLGSRELALMEEQKRQQEERRKVKEAKNKASLSKLPPAPAPDAKPQKSILKNTVAYQPPIIIPSNITISSSEDGKLCNSTPQHGTSEEDTSYSARLKNEESSKCLNKSEIDPNTNNKHVATENSEQTSERRLGEGSGTLNVDDSQQINPDSNIPEGFFDDPVQDAKARHVPYINVEEEEWEKFQKEIGEEMSTAQTILVEDREEATADRQIEEIDEQMEAWRRVSKMEQKKDKVHLRKSSTQGSNETSKTNNTTIDSDSNDEDQNFEEFVSWRKKR